MPSSDLFVAFVIASVVLIAIPGPSMLFVVGRSLALGRRGGLLSVLGNALGLVPLVIAVAVGLGAVVAGSVVVFTVVKLLGAAYLVYLGIQTIRHRGEGPDGADQTGTRRVSGWVTLRQGFVVGVTNPKIIMFFVAALPQFVDVHAGTVPLQLMVLGLVFVALALVCDSVWAILAGTARDWFASSPRRLAGIRASGGVMMIGLGGTLAVTGAKG